LRFNLVIALEILGLLGGVVLGVLWAKNPSGNYEPYLALLGSALALLEVSRRKSKRRKDDVGNLSPITVKEIVDAINSAPPFQRADISKKYNGVRVNWTGYLREAREDYRSAGRVRVNLNIDPDSIVGYSFWFTEAVANFPEVRTLKRKSCLDVVGEIVGASGDGLYVDLKPIKITVLQIAG
jgi:hypothetical protein